MKARLLLVFALTAAIFGVVGATAGADTSPPTNPKHFFWASGQAGLSTPADPQANDLVYHGGNAGDGAIGVETKPAVYLIYWGPEWVKGFKITDSSGKNHSSKALQAYVNDFFKHVGGSSWANIYTQYCKTAAAGATSCAGLKNGFSTNPKGQLKGVWTDKTPVPNDIITLGLAENLVDDPLAQEAIRAAAHFGYNPQATYIILTPPTPIATGEPVYCGYHTQTTGVDGLGNPYRLQYAFIPWLMNMPPGIACDENAVNTQNNAFGNGVFDGYSIVTGHEYAEAVTDPDNIASVQDGWNDNQGQQEIGDKCESPVANITLGKHQYAVQALWSNAAFDKTGSGCVFAGP